MDLDGKNLVGVAVVCAIVIAILLLITSTASSGSESIKVGVVVPLTGDAAVYGQDIRNGIELAKEDFSEQRIDVIYEDACLAPDALKSAQKLVMVDKVKLISGVFCIPSVNAIATQTKNQKIPIMMTASVPQTLIDLNAFVFSPNSAIKEEAYAQAEYAYYKLNSRKASVLWMNSDFGLAYSKNFEKRFTELGGKVILNEPLEFFGKDYKTELSKVKENDSNFLLAVHFGAQIGLILKQAKEMNLNKQIMGTYEAEDDFVISSAQGGAEGLVLSSPVGINTGAKYTEFEAKYIAKYNKSPSVIARMAYDGFVMEINAYNACNKESECVVNYLLNEKKYSGASGEFGLNPDGTGKREFVFKQVKDGKYNLFSQ